MLLQVSPVSLVSMVKVRSLLFAALIISCITLRAQGQDDDIEDIEVVEEEKAFLVVRKNIVDREKVVVGKSVTVEIEIHNAGTSSALDVEVEDQPWPTQQFKHNDGSLTWEAARVPAGSTSKFSYTISPLVAGFYSARPAKIVYRAFPDAPEKTVATSSTPHFHILSTIQKYVQAGLYAGSYITLGSLQTTSDWRNVGIVAALLLSAIGGQAVYKNVTGARKKSLYQRTLEEVNKWK